MKTALTVVSVLCVILLAVVGFGVTKYHALSEDFERTKEANAPAAPIGAKSEASAEVARLAKEVAELKEELAAARGEAAAPVVTSPKGEKKGKGGEGMMKTFAKMMEDPAMKDMMRQQQGIAVKGLYADFSRELGLSEEEETALTELLIDKQMINTELGMKMRGGELSEEEKKAIAKEIKESSEALDEEIKGALGDDHFKSYELFVDSMQERQQLNTLKEGLKSQGLGLSVETEEQLMDAMYSARKNFKFSTNFGSDANPNPEALANFNQEGLEKMMAETRRLNAEIAGKAERILSPEQWEAFRASQESQLKMQEMGMKMGLQMQE